MTPNEIAEAARQKIAGKPELERAMREAWDRVATKIAETIDASNRTHKAYARSNALRNARLAMLTEFVDGKSVEDCEAEALRVSGVEPAGD